MNQADNSKSKQILLTIRELKAKIKQLESKKTEPVAVIGMSCRFPGGVDNPESYWQLLLNKVDAIKEVPVDRWNIEDYFDATPGTEGKMYTRWGGFLDNIDEFDPQFFGIAPKEAEGMDPQQRLLLEVAWEALGRAGENVSRLNGSKTGVFIGITAADYAYSQISKGDLTKIDAYFGTGNALNAAAGRLSYLFGFQGPAMSIDTACSSSLVAIHLACQSLNNNECNLALAGGVNVILSPESTIATSQAKMLSPTGRCHTFDESADGYVRGEGCGLIVLKRLNDAFKDGDPILGVIKGSAINQDGNSAGFTVPNGVAQQTLIREALERAHLSPSDIGYLEAHGTGTSLGDPIEINAIHNVFQSGKTKENPLIVGSVKTNIGHLESASGIAGVIKALLILQNGEIPAHLHLQKVNPHIPIEKMKIKFPLDIIPWPSAQTSKIAGVSSFGFSGTNAHIILEQAPVIEDSIDEITYPHHFFTLSAKSESALNELVDKVKNEIQNNQEMSARDLCYTSNLGRDHFSHRLVSLSSSIKDIGQDLEVFQNKQESLTLIQSERKSEAPSKTVFLFTGQGSQYANMGRELYKSQPVFKFWMDECSRILEDHLDKPLLSVIYGDFQALLDQTVYTQPALFALEYSLFRMWQSWGIHPDAVTGHSVGEIAAACAAEVYSLEDGLKLIAARGKLMQSLPSGGSMLAVFAAEDQVANIIKPFTKSVALASINAPQSMVIAGDSVDLKQIQEICESQAIKIHPLVVSHAFHSPLMDSILNSFAEIASEITYNQPIIPFISNMTGDVIESVDAEYWKEHIRKPVRYYDGMLSSERMGYQRYLEIGPTPILTGLGKLCLPNTSAEWLVSLRRGMDDWPQLLKSLAAFYVQGADIDWAEFYKGTKGYRKITTFPTYPFQRQRYWKSDLSLFDRLKQYSHSYSDKNREKIQPGNQSEREEAIDNLCLGYINNYFASCEVFTKKDISLTPKELEQNLKLTPRYKQLLRGFLGHLKQRGFVCSENEKISATKSFVYQPIDPLLSKAAEICGDSEALVNLIKTCGEHLDNVLGGKKDPVDVLFPEGDFNPLESLYQSTPFSQFYNGLVGEIVKKLTSQLPNDTQLRVIEVGAGTGSTSASTLPVLPGERTNYTFTDISEIFLHKARVKFSEYDFIDYQTLNAEEDPINQGFSKHGYDVVIAANVLHATKSLKETMGHVSSLLAPGGLLVIWEITQPSLWFDLTFGLVLQELADTDFRSESAFLNVNQWELLLKDFGFTDFAAFPKTKTNKMDAGQHVMIAKAPVAVRDAKPAFQVKSKQKVTVEYIQGQEFPLLGSRIQAPNPIFQSKLSPQDHSVLNDHLVFDTRVFPMTGYLEMSFRAARESGVIGNIEFDDFRFQDALVFEEEHPSYLLHTVLLPKESAEYSIEIHSCLASVESSEEKTWRSHVKGRLRKVEQPVSTKNLQQLNEYKERCTHQIDVVKAYNDPKGFGVAYHNRFQSIKSLWKGDKEVLAEINSTDAPGNYIIHPGILDSCFQGLGIYLAIDEQKSKSSLVFLPMFIEKIHIYGDLDSVAWSYGKFETPLDKDVIACRLELYDPHGKVIAEIEELKIKCIHKDYFRKLIQPKKEDWFYQVQWHAEELSETQPPDSIETKENWLIYTDDPADLEVFTETLDQASQAYTFIQPGDSFKQVSDKVFSVNPLSVEDFENCIGKNADLNQDAVTRVLFFGNISTAGKHNQDLTSIAKSQGVLCGGLLNLIQSLVKANLEAYPQLNVITMGTQSIEAGDDSNVQSSSLWGLGRNIINELPDLNCKLIDLDSFAVSSYKFLLQEILNDSKLSENQIAFRNNKRYVGRLERFQQGLPKASLVLPSEPFQVEVDASGLLDNLKFKPTSRKALQSNEVEIEIRATGVNFRDVMIAMGIYPDKEATMGVECSGVISALGDEVKEFKIGDPVIAIAPGSYASHVATRWELVIPKPIHMSFEQAATVLNTFLSASYPLRELVKIKKGNKVLIHAATGGVGLAAIQIAKAVGAEVYTTAGKPFKREYLESLGIKYVGDSRTSDFAEEIAQQIGESGIDIVLNSLTGEAIDKSLSLLKPGGYFIELGKTDLRNPDQIDKEINYLPIALDQLVKNDPTSIQSILKELSESFENKVYLPIPMKVYQAEHFVEAFRLMQQANHLGKIVVSYRQNQTISKQLEGRNINKEGTYLITGGSGGLGLKVAHWLVENGAKNLVLVSRKPPEDSDSIKALEDSGATVFIEAVDVSDYNALKQTIEKYANSGAPLKGVWHCAGLLDDGILTKLTWSQFENVFAPKVQGTWNLHLLTQHLDLDFFVLFSSIASLFGNPGQANHAAANAFMDAVAHHRNSQGLPVVSINWGAWSEIGSAAFKEGDDSLSSIGLGFIDPNQGIAAMEEALASYLPQIAILPVDWVKFGESLSNQNATTLFSNLIKKSKPKKAISSPTADSDVFGQIQKAAGEERLSLLKQHLVKRASEVLGWKNPESINTGDSLINLGMDSLMAVELRNKISQDLDGIPLPDTLLLDQPNVNALAEYLLKKLPESKAEDAETNNKSIEQPETVEEETTAIPPSQYPLTYAQKGIWFLYKMQPDMYAYNVIVGLRIVSDLNVAVLEKSLQELVFRHSALRTQIVDEKEGPVQKIMNEVDAKLAIHHLGDLSADELKGQILSSARKPFNLEQGLPFRFDLFQSQNETVLLLVVHHIIIDGASVRILLDELVRLYNAQTSGNPILLEPLKKSYADYVAKRKILLAGPESEEHLQYWRDLLKGPLPVLNLPIDRQRPAIFSFNGASCPFDIDIELVNSLYKFCRTENCTMNMLLVAAFKLFLARLSGQEDIIVGTGTSGRNYPGFDRVVGHFINVTVLRGNIEKSVTFREFLNETKEQIISSLKHQDYPFQLLVEKLNIHRDPSRTPIFEAVLNFQSESLNPIEKSQQASGPNQIIGEHYEIEDQSGNVELTLEFIESDRRLSGSLKYNTDLYKPETIQRWTQNFCILLKNIVADPAVSISHLDMLADEERYLLFKGFQGKQHDFPLQKTAVNLFEEQAAKNPNHVALIHDNIQLTYKELNERANQVAREILDHKIEPQSVIGVYLEKSPDLVISLLAILKTRCVYLPLDTSNPIDRISFILEDSSSKAVITNSNYLNALYNSDYKNLVINIESEQVRNQLDYIHIIRGVAEDLAYIIYTSGSTGKPKGVLVRNKGFVNMIYDHITEFEITSDDRCLQFAAASFDVSLFEIFMPLLAGASLVIASKETVKDGLQMIRYIDEKKVTVAAFTASYLKALDQNPLPSIRALIVGGEPADWKDVHFYAKNKNYYNAYGPSECSVCATHYKCTPEAALKTKIPIGKPVRNGEIYVLDENLNPVPLGVRGEICVAGPGLAVGYLNRPNLTEKVFVPHPFKPGERLYRSGDIGRWLPDGNIEFLGRKDHQVKIRGHRIEIGEIENELKSLAAVEDVVVLDEKLSSGDVQLVAYVIMKNADAKISVEELKKAISNNLPEYMIPTSFHFVESFPKTTSGKIDRKSLPSMVELSQAPASSVVEGKDVQGKLLNIWKQTLGKQNISVKDNFFEIGGDSLLAIQVVSKILKEFNKEIPMSLFFQNQTIAELSGYLKDEVREVKDSPLVNLQPKGDKNPVFAIHGAGGNIVFFHTLAKQLGTDRPFWALQSTLFPHKDRTINRMANEYYREIKKVQNKGPYVLIGYCMGGVIAQEIALELERSGEKVNLVLLDTYLLKSWQVSAWLKWKTIAQRFVKSKKQKTDGQVYLGDKFRWKMFQDYINGIVQLNGKSADIPYQRYHRLDLNDRYLLVANELNRQGIFNSHIEINTLIKEFKEFEANNLALIAHKPKSYKGKTLLVSAEETYNQPGVCTTSDHGFANFNSQLEIVQVPGNHFSILTMPYVEFVANVIKKNMED